MKAAEIRGLAQSELEKQLADLQSELYNLRFQQATRQLTNTSRVRQVKRNIARLLTLLRERELNAPKTR
jgi:large subunit ribosomal protein L29